MKHLRSIAEVGPDGLQRLLKYQFESLLVGDGTSILAAAKQPVERLLQA